MAASVQELLAGGLKVARDNVMNDALANGEGEVRPEEVVFETLTLAMNTLNRLPNPEAGWLSAQGFWPQIFHDNEEQIENYREMVRRIASGEESPEILMRRRPPSAVEIGRMEAVFEVFPKCLIGKQRSRDWKIVCFLAAGRTTRLVAKIAKCSDKTVRDRRFVQLSQIAQKLAHLMPAPHVEGAPERPIYMTDRAA